MANTPPGQRLARARLDYASALGQQRCNQLINEKRSNAQVQPSTGCWLFQGSTNNDGYGQVWAKTNARLLETGRSAQTAFLIHIVAYVAHHGTDVPAGTHISHLCDNRRCFNPDHLVGESAQTNNSRKGCSGSIICSVHGYIIVDLCTHHPHCIRPPREDVICCLAMKDDDPHSWARQQTKSRVNYGRLVSVGLAG